MIVIKVELWPFGNESRKRILGTATISSDGSGAEHTGYYDARFCDRRGRLWMVSRVAGFPRKRLLSWDLLFRALRNAIGDRNGVEPEREEAKRVRGFAGASSLKTEN